MLSLGGARGVEKAELNGNVDSDNNHGGSSRTYVLHRTGCSQEDDQLLRQGCERSGSPGRPDRSNTLPTPAGAPDGADEESDLRSADGNRSEPQQAAAAQSGVFPRATLKQRRGE